nr:hypothetical protein K-LCC10_0073 [Kaumoebavirus]
MDLLKYKESSQLFLKGVYIKDCNLMYRGDTFVPVERAPVEITYDKLLSKFTKLEDWPTSTNLKCWHCDCNFVGTPAFIPLSMNSHGEAMSHGNFCTIFCAAGYIDNHQDPMVLTKKKWEYLEMLKLLYKIFTKRTIKQIFPAPPKTVMIQYGGTKTVDEYKKFLKELEENSMDGLVYSSAPSIIKQYF